EPDILNQATVFLEREKDCLNVITASSAKDALDLLDEQEIDAIVSDYQMPGMEGLEFLKTVRRGRDCDVPFIMLTGKGHEDVAMSALNMGANGYLKKGTDPEVMYKDLAEMLVREIENYRAERREEMLHSLLRHDLRNKAQIATGYLELLKDFTGSEEEKYIEKAMESIEEGVDLIEKVRTLRKIEESETEKVMVEPLLETVIDDYSDQTSREGIRILQGECECKEVMAGPFLRNLVSNLVENAVKHSDGSKIMISCEEENGNCLIIVEDDGKGIPDEEKEKIFNKGLKKGKNSGTGLGLYLVKEVAESYGGHVEVKDSKLGGGRFVIHLQEA
ncbi:hypothetical protein AKJ50_01390, partial [candidate division MSBL1 archaeon SCGC-AAA382A13]